MTNYHYLIGDGRGNFIIEHLILGYDGVLREIKLVPSLPLQAKKFETKGAALECIQERLSDDELNVFKFEYCVKKLGE